MSAIIRFATALVTTLTLAGSLTACQREPVDLGAFPGEDDDGIVAEVSAEEATQVAEVALAGYNDGDYARWTTRWDRSLLDAIEEPDWQDIRRGLLDQVGRYEAILETRVTAAEEPGHVRFSFLVRFERAELVMVHVYPEDEARITGVHLREPE